MQKVKVYNLEHIQLFAQGHNCRGTLAVREGQVQPVLIKKVLLLFSTSRFHQNVYHLVLI